MLETEISISKERGKLLQSPSGESVCVTAHPSSIHRQRGKDNQEAAYRKFLADIKSVRSYLG